MTNLEKAIEIEKKHYFNSNDKEYLFKLIQPCGFNSWDEYVEAKGNYLFEQWIPEVYYVSIKEYAEIVENALDTDKYGIYISQGEGVHAYHGNGDLDRELCKELNVEVVDLKYSGGTIIGSAKDLSIIIVFPRFMELPHEFFIEKIVEIMSEYISEVSIDRNDILIEGNKVSGSMMRHKLNSSIWAAQISFEDYANYIGALCDKPAIKKPSYVNSELITRDELENKIVAWLRKEDN